MVPFGCSYDITTDNMIESDCSRFIFQGDLTYSGRYLLLGDIPEKLWDRADELVQQLFRLVIPQV